MINDDVSSFFILRKGVVPGSVQTVFFITLHDRIAELLPGSRIQKICPFLCNQKSHTVSRTRIACTEGHEQLSAVLQNSRSFIDPEAVPLPVIVRRGQKNLRRCQLIRTLHPCDVQIGDLPADADLFRPDIVPLTGILKYRGIQRERLK